MALKKNRTIRAEPCYEVAVSMCPRSTTNETSGKLLCRETINKVFTNDCYDNTPNKPWMFTFGARRRPLTAEQQHDRLEWAKRISREGKSPEWLKENIVWIDICSKVNPGSPAKAYDQLQAGRNKPKPLISPDAADE